MSLSTFVQVTKPAGQPEILFGIGTAAGLGNEVFNLQEAKHIPLLALAVAAAVTCLGADSFPKLCGDAHGGSSDLKPAACGLCHRLRLPQQPRFVVLHEPRQLGAPVGSECSCLLVA